jgi:hypothetical protein
MQFTQFAELIGLKLTPAQRALCATSFDGVAPPPEYLDLFGGVAPPTCRTVVWVCGRSSGKTTMGAAAVLWRGLTADLSALGAGEKAFGILIAPDKPLATQTLTLVSHWIESSPALTKLVESRTADSVTLRRPDGRLICISVFAASRGGSAVRGKSVLAAALDEAAFFRTPGSAVVNDADIYNAIMPRLTKGAFILLETTPWMQAGLVHALHKEQFGKSKTALVALAPTERMRTDDPDLQAMIQAERARDPGNAAREYDCEWLAVGSGNAFDLNALNASVVPETLRTAGRIAIGGDIGLVRDMSAFVAVQEGPGGAINVLGVREMRPRKGAPLSLTAVLREAQDFAREYGCNKIRVDHHSLAPAQDTITRERLTLTLEPCNDGADSREYRYTGLIQAFKAGRVHIPNKHGHLVDQLARVVATPRQAGGHTFSVNRTGGDHADSAMALILAAEPFLKRKVGIGDFNDNALRNLCSGFGVSDYQEFISGRKKAGGF